MSHEFSNSSNNKLIGVRPALKKVFERAIGLSTVDFGIGEGIRLLERQQKLLDSGATTTLKSKHIDGSAGDTKAYVRGAISWELIHYDEIAEAVRRAAIELGVPIIWGAAWVVGDIRYWAGTMREAREAYTLLREKQYRLGERKNGPFVDAVHFELA